MAALATLAYPDLLSSPVTGPTAPMAPAIQPASAPLYVQPVSVPMLRDPMIAPAPDGQFRGEGGTAFGSRPTLYVQPLAPEVADSLSNGGIYRPPVDDAYNINAPVIHPPVAPERPGDSTIQPVPVGQQPTKPNVAPAVQPVTVPASSGPIKGQFLGLDLGVVPLWAWLVGAALIGARILR